jgi:hypothetical protein
MLSSLLFVSYLSLSDSCVWFHVLSFGLVYSRVRCSCELIVLMCACLLLCGLVCSRVAFCFLIRWCMCV